MSEYCQQTKHDSFDLIGQQTNSNWTDSSHLGRMAKEDSACRAHPDNFYSRILTETSSRPPQHSKTALLHSHNHYCARKGADCQMLEGILQRDSSRINLACRTLLLTQAQDLVVQLQAPSTFVSMHSMQRRRNGVPTICWRQRRHEFGHTGHTGP